MPPAMLLDLATVLADDRRRSTRRLAQSSVLRPPRRFHRAARR